MSEYQRQKIIGLLETAHTLAVTREDNNLADLIERAIDKARAGPSAPKAPPAGPGRRPPGTRRPNR